MTKTKNLDWSGVKKPKIHKIVKKLILIKILVKTIFESPIFNFRGHLSTKIFEIQGVTSTPWSLRLKKPKPWTYRYWPQNNPMHHLTLHIDRSRSHVSVTFFPGSVRFLNRPKRSILFSIFWSFFLDHLKSWSIIYSRKYYNENGTLTKQKYISTTVWSEWLVGDCARRLTAIRRNLKIEKLKSKRKATKHKIALYFLWNVENLVLMCTFPKIFPCLRVGVGAASSSELRSSTWKTFFEQRKTLKNLGKT